VSRYLQKFNVLAGDNSLELFVILLKTCYPLVQLVVGEGKAFHSILESVELEGILEHYEKEVYYIDQVDRDYEQQFILQEEVMKKEVGQWCNHYEGQVKLDEELALQGNKELGIDGHMEKAYERVPSFGHGYKKKKYGYGNDYRFCDEFRVSNRVFIKNKYGEGERENNQSVNIRMAAAVSARSIPRPSDTVVISITGKSVNIRSCAFLLRIKQKRMTMIKKSIIKRIFSNC